jgi:hypothetical protein
MRTVITAIDKIISCVPVDEKYNYAIARLREIRRDATYHPPEQAGEDFGKIALVLSEYFRPVDADWKKQIQQIFNDK